MLSVRISDQFLYSYFLYAWEKKTECAKGQLQSTIKVDWELKVHTAN